MFSLFQSAPAAAPPKPSKNKKEKGGDKGGQLTEISPPPSFIQSREELWKDLQTKYIADLAAKQPQTIQVTLPDGKVVPADSWRTTPYDVAKGIRFV